MHLLVDFIQLLLQQLRIAIFDLQRFKIFILPFAVNFIKKKKKATYSSEKKNKSMLDNEFNLTFN